MSRETSVEDRLLAPLLRRSGGLIGDDAAILPAESWAVTTDTQIAGSHFPADLDPALIARRLLAVNLSDLAAMGAEPAFAFLVLAAPASFDHRCFLDAFEQACQEAGVRLAGGDLSSQEQVATIATLLGRQTSGGRWLRRDDAHPGHRLWLGGSVGESALGLRLVQRGARLGALGTALAADLSALQVTTAAEQALRRHLEPAPQLALGAWLAQQESGGVIDVSDGLGKDLARLCKASGVGADVHSRRLPEPADFTALCQALDCDPLPTKLSGGEDYVLLFSLPEGIQPPAALHCQQIGNITQPAQVILVDQGRRRPLPTVGWDHLSKGS